MDDAVPFLVVRCVIFGFADGTLRALLRRPGGVGELHELPGREVRWEESLEEAAREVVLALTSSANFALRQFHTFGGAARHDPAGLNGSTSTTIGASTRPARTISVGYFALVDLEAISELSEADALGWCAVTELPPLRLDHEQMIGRALEALRVALPDPAIGMNLLPDKFTMSELQKLHECILERPLDRRNFQKKVLDSGVVERLPERKRGYAYPAPYFYRFGGSAKEEESEGTNRGAHST